MSFFKDVTTPQDFNKPTEIPRHPLTGINVLIVGAGPAGLYTALECWRKGHSPRVIERAPSPSSAGPYSTAPEPNRILMIFDRDRPDMLIPRKQKKQR